MTRQRVGFRHRYWSRRRPCCSAIMRCVEYDKRLIVRVLVIETHDPVLGCEELRWPWDKLWAVHISPPRRAVLHYTSSIRGSWQPLLPPSASPIMCDVEIWLEISFKFPCDPTCR